MGSTVLSADHIKLRYGGREAVRDLSFSLKQGEILGFLGPNGAGKTSAIRVLTTIFKPSSGTFQVAGIGHDKPERIRALIGVLPESHGYPPFVTAFEYLVTQACLFGASRSAAKAKATTLLKEVGLAARQHSPVSAFSRGMRQRLGIARALVNDPVVVFLDEPTLGLDPLGQEELMKLVKWVAREKGAAVVLCSHLLNEIESACDSIIILAEGEVIAHGPVATVVAESKRRSFRIQVALDDLGRAKAKVAEKYETGRAKALADGWIEIRLDDDALDVATRSNELLAALVAAKIVVLGFEAGAASLHDAFMELTAAAP